jgi:hypothetical protein
MKPDKVSAVLRDYRSGKASSATELAKLHGVSRSAVYRLLKAETGKGTDTSQQQSQAQQVQAAPQRPEKASDDTETGESLMDTLFTKAEAFANNLGLPEVSGEVKHVEVKDEAAEREKEEKLDAFIDTLMGNQLVAMNLPEGLQAALDAPMEKPVHVRRRVNYQDLEETPREVEEVRAPPPEARRAEVIQKIIFNLQHFGPQLEVITGPNREQYIQTLTSMSVPQLRETLTTLERTRSVGNIANGFKHVFYMLGQATETATQFIGMTTQGFTSQLKAQEEEVSMIMKEIAIEQWERLKVMDSPQVRLSMLFCMTLIQVDTRNKLEAHFKQSQAVPESIARSSVDL